MKLKLVHTTNRKKDKIITVESYADVFDEIIELLKNDSPCIGKYSENEITGSLYLLQTGTLEPYKYEFYYKVVESSKRFDTILTNGDYELSAFNSKDVKCVQDVNSILYAMHTSDYIVEEI